MSICVNSFNPPLVGTGLSVEDQLPHLSYRCVGYIVNKFEQVWGPEAWPRSPQVNKVEHVQGVPCGWAVEAGLGLLAIAAEAEAGAPWR